jgi:hypothetical protein
MHLQPHTPANYFAIQPEFEGFAAHRFPLLIPIPLIIEAFELTK